MRIKSHKDTDTGTDDSSGSDVINCMCVCLHALCFYLSMCLNSPYVFSLLICTIARVCEEDQLTSCARLYP